LTGAQRTVAFFTVTEREPNWSVTATVSWFVGQIVVAFCVWAGLLKLDPDWLSGAALRGARPWGVPRRSSRPRARGSSCSSSR
jgi:hypothetical protein